MGGEQAAAVLSTVRRDGVEARGGPWAKEDEEVFKENIRQQYEVQGHPYYAAGWLWDDGVIDPAWGHGLTPDSRSRGGMEWGARRRALVAEARCPPRPG